MSDYRPVSEAELRFRRKSVQEMNWFAGAYAVGGVLALLIISFGVPF